MADSTTAIDRKDENAALAGRVETIIKNAEVLVVGGLTAMLPSTGYSENQDSTAGLIPLGVVEHSSVGDNSATGLTGDASKKVVTRTGQTIVEVAVTGASAITDFGKLVYGTDNQTLTLTKPTAGLPIGWVKRWVSSTTCDVQLFTLSESIMWSFIPQKQRIYLGYLSAQSMGGTAAVDLLTYTVKSAMQLDTLVAMPMVDDASLAGAQTLNLEIGAVDVTGDLALAYTDCDADADLGTEVSQALSGSNTANQGDVITLEMAASGTGFTTDTLAGFNIYLDVTMLPGS